MRRIQAIDSHTAGEPTRIVIDGAPLLGDGSIAQRLQVLREQHDRFRSAVVNEPRGSDVLVGALLLPPSEPSCTAGVIFFNNVGYLGMCGHGTMGLIVTLAHLGRIRPGPHRIETPVGVVTATLHESSEVSVQNVQSYRLARDITVRIDGHRSVTGDVAWGGNWFYLVNNHSQELVRRNVEQLSEFCWHIRQALDREQITGAGGHPIDHIELIAPSSTPGVHARNFVLCPGKAYDRSPCGTGTSAKLACLHADGKLQPGQIWRQEGILGTVFEGSVTIVNGQVVPTIKGAAYVTAETTLLLDERDPFCWGIGA